MMISLINYLLLIDNYIDLTTLDILSKNTNNIKIIIYTKDNKLKEIDINKYNEEYHNLEVKYINIFHNRFLIIDNINLYHIGASIKDAGKKCFAINKIEDINIINSIIDKIS